MTFFLDNITPFLGTGENNEDGLSLEEFLNQYDPNKYQNPSVTADILVIRYEKDFTAIHQGLRLLMIKRKNHPGIGSWALPGGFVNLRENLEEAAKRELQEETGLSNIVVEQLCCWGNWERDPRTRIVTVSYLAMVEDGLEVKAGDDAAEAVWMDISVEKGESVEIEGRIRTEYTIQLSNSEQQISLSTTVEYSENAVGFLKEVKYKVIKSDGIAFDHPCFILQALLHIEHLVQTKK